MSTDTLLRSTSHPPCPEDAHHRETEILQITLPADRTELTIADRLSLRLGLWLMSRTQRPPRARTPELTREETTRILDARRKVGNAGTTEREALAILTYDMHRSMR